MEERDNLYAPNRWSVNIAIIVATALSFFVFLFWEKGQTRGSFYGNTTSFLLEHGALFAPSVFWNGEWYRLITYLFLHGGIEHLINNMLILYFMGNSLEAFLGRIRYVILYFCSGILAGIGSIVYNGYIQTGNLSLEAMKNVFGYPVCIGASGAVFGVTGAMLYLVLIHGGRIRGLTKRQMLVFLVLSIYGGLVDKGVDNAAHIAGLAAGFLLAAILYGKPKHKEAQTIQSE